MELIRPTHHHLSDYAAALKRGWAPDNLRAASTQDELDAIARNPDQFLAAFEDREAVGGPITLPDGTRAPRLPGIKRCIWSDGFCGIIGMRWQPGTEELPLHCCGHVGYSVVPWRRREGLATRALQALLPEAKKTGLRYIELATHPQNIPSIKVIESAGGILVERCRVADCLGGVEAVRFHIQLRDEGG